MLSNVWKMYLISFLRNVIFFGAVTVPFFTEWGRLSYTQLFLLESWFMLWIFFLEVPSGVFADKYGRRISIALSGIFIALGSVVFVIKPDFYLFLLGEFLWAAGIAISSGAETAIIYDTLKELGSAGKAKYVFSRNQIAATMGVIVSFPLGSFMAGMMILPYPNNLTVPVALTAVPLVLSVFAAFFLKEPKRKRSGGNPFSMAMKGIKYLARHKPLRALALDYVLIGATAFLMFWLYQPLLKTSGVDITLWGVVAALFNLFGIMLLLNIRNMERLFGVRGLLFLSALVPGVVYLLLGFYQPLWLVLSGIFLIVGLNQMRMPLFEHYMNFYIKSSERATVLSAVSMLGRVVLILLYPVIGFLLDWSLDYALILLGVLTIIFALTSKVEEKMLR